jgi:hypothetical protein
VDLQPQLREQIHLLSRFLAVLRFSAKLFSRNFGMTHASLNHIAERAGWAESSKYDIILQTKKDAVKAQKGKL